MLLHNHDVLLSRCSASALCFSRRGQSQGVNGASSSASLHPCAYEYVLSTHTCSHGYAFACKSCRCGYKIQRSESVLDKNVLRFYQVPVPVVVPPQKKEMKDAAVQLEVIEQPKGKEDAAREEMTDEAPNFSTGAHSFIITTTC